MPKVLDRLGPRCRASPCSPSVLTTRRRIRTAGLCFFARTPSDAGLKESVLKRDKAESCVTPDLARQIGETRPLQLEHWTILTGHPEGECYGAYRVSKEGVLKPLREYRFIVPSPQRTYARRFKRNFPLRSKMPRTGLFFPCEPPELLGFALSLDSLVSIPPDFRRRVIELSPTHSKDAYLRYRFFQSTLILSDDATKQYADAWDEDAAGEMSCAEMTGMYLESPKPVPTKSIRMHFPVPQGLTEEQWNKRLADPTGPLRHARVGPTRRRRSAYWNPVVVADWMATSGGAGKTALTIVIEKHFSSWLSEWERVMEFQ